MHWLREIRVRVGRETFTSIVDRVLPVLAEGKAVAQGQRLADLWAHTGWAYYLRSREGASGLDPQVPYQKALAAEASNTYAHAMWGHYLTARKELTDEGKAHFAAAVASGRDRPFVRALLLASLMEYGCLLASLEQAAAERDAAPARYEALRQELERTRSAGSIFDATMEAVKQLRKP